jgi:hypothetical protein
MLPSVKSKWVLVAREIQVLVPPRAPKATKGTGCIPTAGAADGSTTSQFSWRIQMKSAGRHSHLGKPNSAIHHEVVKGIKSCT